ncbi:MAG: FMN-binding negative transcriptional regulator [Actinomycetota bacterium]|nr:FMN-binding negative transcriptional regulator [Actinomycetota bacterium]
MYIPPHFKVADRTVADLLAGAVTGDLVTATPSGPTATFLPVLYEPEVGERGAFLGHLARANEQWRLPTLGEGLLILHGPDAYVSPSWYPSKAEHGKVVPTWDYLVVHVYGRLVVHDDMAWLESLVRRLTTRHEAGREAPWSVDDAPASFVQAQLRAIVGIELVIERVEAKAKWSQNRPAPDVAGVIAGLEAAGEDHAAAALRAANRS